MSIFEKLNRELESKLDDVKDDTEFEVIKLIVAYNNYLAVQMNHLKFSTAILKHLEDKYRTLPNCKNEKLDDLLITLHSYTDVYKPKEELQQAVIQSINSMNELLGYSKLY